MMTDSVDSPLGNLGVELLEIGPDLLAELVNDEEPLSEIWASKCCDDAAFLVGLPFYL